MFTRVLVAVTVVAISACSSGSSGSTATQPEPATETVTITIRDFAFGDPVTASVGDTIEVTNADGVAHTWTSTDGLFDSGSIAPGDTFTFTFDSPGEYPFVCTIHPSMQGTISISG